MKYHDIKIYAQHTSGHRQLFDFTIEAETERDAAEITLANFNANNPAYTAQVVEAGGCRHQPGAGRIYFVAEGEIDPRETYAPESRGQFMFTK